MEQFVPFIIVRTRILTKVTKQNTNAQGNPFFLSQGVLIVYMKVQLGILDKTNEAWVVLQTVLWLHN